MSDLAEHIGLQGTYVSRPESPTLEGAAAEANEQAFRDLIENRYLYQKVRLDLRVMEKAVATAVEAAAIRRDGSADSGQSLPVEPATPARLKVLTAEIERRPWQLLTRHLSDDRTAADIRRHARVGTQPLGTPVEKMNILFYLPSVQLRCPNRCKGNTTFIALGSSTGFIFDSPYPRESGIDIEQIYTPIYRCEMCRETLYTLLVRRFGPRLHLCGFAPRREPFVAPQAPEGVAPILSDAEQAVAEGDIYAALYHLRTMMEHHLKARLSIPIEQQIRGDELVARHYATLPKELGSVLPSLTTAWERLSQCLHTRTGHVEDYQRERDAICNHFQALDLLSPAAPITGSA
jgi:hypothetical protein